MDLKTQSLATLCITTLLAVSCATMSPHEMDIVNRAKTIQKNPVPRKTLIKTLGLQSFPSEPLSGGSMRGGNMLFNETWTLASGITLIAYDREFIGDVPIQGDNYDVILGNQHGKATRNPKPKSLPARKSFESISICSAQGKLLYHSDQIVSPVISTGY